MCKLRCLDESERELFRVATEKIVAATLMVCQCHTLMGRGSVDHQSGHIRQSLVEFQSRQPSLIIKHNFLASWLQHDGGLLLLLSLPGWVKLLGCFLLATTLLARWLPLLPLATTTAAGHTLLSRLLLLLLALRLLLWLLLWLLLLGRLLLRCECLTIVAKDHLFRCHTRSNQHWLPLRLAGSPRGMQRLVPLLLLLGLLLRGLGPPLLLLLLPLLLALLSVVRPSAALLLPICWLLPGASACVAWVVLCLRSSTQ